MPREYMPPVEEFFVSGWYLRGDIGMTNQRFKGLHQRHRRSRHDGREPVGMGWDNSTFFGLGVGYKINEWFRTDSLANIAARRTSTARITSRHRPAGAGGDDCSGSKTDELFMANGDLDLDTWWSLTP